MLSRTADNLYWLGRYVERAENTARLLSGTQRLSLMPIPTDEAGNLWRNLFQSEVEENAFLAKHSKFSEAPVMEYMALDPENPSSIYSCVHGARENVRAARHVLTTEISQCINETWMEVRNCGPQDVIDRGTQNYLDSIKERAHLFRGVVHGTMRRGEPFMFWELGAALERAENTSRLMLARSAAFHRAAKRDDGFDFYRWGTFLRTANAYSAYRQLYRDIDPVSVADLLILNTQIPRSLLSCIEDTAEVLRSLKREAQCAAMAERLASELRTMRLDTILRSGLEGFLHDFRKQVHVLSDQIRVDFIMVR
tara:strand:- start:2288 stop:3217 length:930 start_codon:yes stop_codon:yes gene_type:complete